MFLCFYEVVVIRGAVTHIAICRQLRP